MIFNADSRATRIYCLGMAKLGMNRNRDGAWRLIKFMLHLVLLWGKQMGYCELDGVDGQKRRGKVV